MPKHILIPIPATDFDPTETAVPWKVLTDAGIKITFATPTGKKATCDQRMLYGTGLGPLKQLLACDQNARICYQKMNESIEFSNPIAWKNIDSKNFDGLILPGGHAKGMREYLESKILQNTVVNFFESDKPVGAICHGVVLVARSKTSSGKNILHGRKTTALLASQEISAWLLTCLWLNSYYRTYPVTVESEVKSALGSPSDFIKGPLPLLRDRTENLSPGFVVRDRNYLSARWPGDAYLFANTFLKIIF